MSSRTRTRRLEGSQLKTKEEVGDDLTYISVYVNVPTPPPIVRDDVEILAEQLQSSGACRSHVIKMCMEAGDNGQEVFVLLAGEVPKDGYTERNLALFKRKVHAARVRVVDREIEVDSEAVRDSSGSYPPVRARAYRRLRIRTAN